MSKKENTTQVDADTSCSIETPSLLSEEDKKRIAEYAQMWKTAKSKTGKREEITYVFKKEFKNNKEALDYYNSCKHSGRKTSAKSKQDKTDTAIAKRLLNDELASCLKVIFDNSSYDDNLFNFGENGYQIDSFFWTMFHKRVAPSISQDKKDLAKIYKYSCATIQLHRKEFVNNLKNINFHDKNHLWNYVIKFLSSKILSTYKILSQQKHQQELQEQKLRDELEKERMQQEFLSSITDNNVDSNEEEIVEVKPTNNKRNYDKYL